MENIPEPIMDDEGEDCTLLHEEAREVVTKQLSRTETIETRAGRILRVSLLTVGVILTATSIGLQWIQQAPQSAVPELPAGSLIYFIFSIFAVGGSAIFAAIAYTAAPIRFGPSGRDIRRLYESNSNNSTRVELVAGYSLWSDINREPLENSRFWITVSISCIALSTIFLGLGVFVIIISPPIPIWIHSLVIPIVLIVVGRVMGISSAYHSYDSASNGAKQAREDFWTILNEGEIDHVLEGASFGGEDENEQSKIRQVVFGKALEDWTVDNLDSIVPQFDEVLFDDREQGGNIEDLLVKQEDGTRVSVVAKAQVNGRIAKRMLSSPAYSADPRTDMYVVSFDYTDEGREILEERDYIHLVSVDKEDVEKYRNSE